MTLAEQTAARATGEPRECAECRHKIWPHPDKRGHWIAADGSTLCHEWSVLGGYCPPDHVPKARRRI
ncbi:hypothetical protein ACIRPH_31350 [Nocardiopsis sp. NPDC101807]|uniref:hypothetical protein n=1 Tax=Nocardiopsis sp. NPDC101807 TaxID=3364339 RepID=UPI00382A4D1D